MAMIILNFLAINMTYHLSKKSLANILLRTLNNIINKILGEIKAKGPT